MRLLLHIGMPKTGSTALQDALYSSRDVLLEKGIYYPPTPFVHKTHNILAAIMTGELPRNRDKSDVVNLEEVIQNWTRKLKLFLLNNNVENLILSSETVFNNINSNTILNLKKFIDEFNYKVHIICYVRKPADFYLSSTQQKLKRSKTIRMIAPINYKIPLSLCNEHISKNISVINYNNIIQTGGDIVKDFRERFLDGLEAEDIKRSAKRMNETLSAEGMAIMQTYRGIFHPQANTFFKEDSQALLKKLTQAEQEIGVKRPVLYKDIADQINHGSPDLLWLRDEYGIVFDGIDYERIGAPIPPQQKITVEDICAVDSARKERLLLETIRLFAQEENTRPPRPQEAAPARPSPAPPLLKRFRFW